MPDPSLHDFIEHAGMFFESSGLPGTSGRILGHLLVCDPPEQSAKQLAQGLETTSGSISTNTRLLVQVGLIERVPKRGERGTFFRIAPGAWTTLFASKEAQTKVFREILDEGIAALAALPGADAARTARIREAHDFHVFFEREFPKLLVRYAEWKEGGG